MNLSNAWENVYDIYSSFSLAYFSVKRTSQVVNTVNQSLVLPGLLSTKASASKDLIYLQPRGESNPMSSF